MAFDSSVDPRIEKLNRLLLIANALDDVPLRKYNQSVWESECGTIHCALGWGITKHGAETMGGFYIDHCHQLGIMGVSSSDLTWLLIGERLGLTEDEAKGLFGGSGRTYHERTGYLRLVTPQDVAGILREVNAEKISQLA